MMTIQVNQLSEILREQGLENYTAAVQELAGSIDVSKRFVCNSDLKA